MSIFTPREVEFLRGLATSRRAEHRLSTVGRYFAERFNVGRLRGSRILYEEKDWELAANLLGNRSHGLAQPARGGSRSEQGPGGSEKDYAGAVGRDLVAIVPLHMDVAVPPGSRFLVANRHEIDLASFDLILECENAEPLGELASFEWLEQRFVRGRRTLAVFRGGPGLLGTAAPAAFIEQAAKPVLGFYDFDPEGLCMAASEPRLEGLCLPAWDGLVATTRRFHRAHLYLDSVQACRSRLEALPGGQVREAWLHLKSLQCGLNQENFPRKE